MGNLRLNAKIVIPIEFKMSNIDAHEQALKAEQASCKVKLNDGSGGIKEVRTAKENYDNYINARNKALEPLRNHAATIETKIIDYENKLYEQKKPNDETVLNKLNVLKDLNFFIQLLKLSDTVSNLDLCITTLNKFLASDDTIDKLGKRTNPLRESTGGELRKQLIAEIKILRTEMPKVLDSSITPIPVQVDNSFDVDAIPETRARRG